LCEIIDTTVLEALSWPAVATRSVPGPGVATEVLTPEEVATYLRLSRKTVYRMARSGELPAFKAANHWRVRCVDLEDWISRRTIAGRTA
jgi:excisionase family DNA binding protein